MINSDNLWYGMFLKDINILKIMKMIIRKKVNQKNKNRTYYSNNIVINNRL